MRKLSGFAAGLSGARRRPAGQALKGPSGECLLPVRVHTSRVETGRAARAEADGRRGPERGPSATRPFASVPTPSAPLSPRRDLSSHI